MLRAKHHFFIYPLFQIYSLWIIRKHFHEVKIIGDYEDQELPTLVISNHISWWDGFWLMYLNLKLLKRKFHFMMLYEQLKKHWYFNYSGGYSVRKNSKSILETLSYTNEILQNPENMVFIFPQGEIQSMHKQKIDFEQGIIRILSKQKNEIQIIFVVNMIDYLSNKKPSLNLYIRQFKSTSITPQDINKSYNNFYQSSLNDIQLKSV